MTEPSPPKRRPSGVGIRGGISFSLRSKVKLIPVVDFDDGRGIAIGETIIGSYRADSDWYTIDL